MRLRVLLLWPLLAGLAACEQKAAAPHVYEVGLTREFANDFNGFAAPPREAVINGSVTRRMGADYDKAWPALLTVAAQCGFIAQADRETGVVICAALPAIPDPKTSSRPDPYAFPPPAFCLERRGSELYLHANWNVAYYQPLRPNAGLALKDADKTRIANLLFDAVEIQAQSTGRWPWLSGRP